MSSPSTTMVVALGGNAIVKPGEEGSIEAQFAQTARTCRQLVSLVQQGHRLVITHGNGPQVGHSLRRVELSAARVQPLPLEMCVAETQGTMGYMIAQCLTNALREAGIERSVSTIVTTVVVDANDPAMKKPTKPIGREYTPQEAEARRSNGWVLRRMPSGNYRRVVASPTPVEVLELPQIARLVQAGELVIACGGGGIPVVRQDGNRYAGVPGVIDKDLASALLGIGIGAEVLLILTNVEQVQTDFGTLHARPISRLTVAEAEALLAAGQFPPGSMGPKITAAINFLKSTPAADPKVILTSSERTLEALAGSTGTLIERG